VTGGEGTQVEGGGGEALIEGMCSAGRRYSIRGWHDCLAAAAAVVAVPRLTAVTAAGGGGAARVGREADVLVLVGDVAGGGWPTGGGACRLCSAGPTRVLRRACPRGPCLPRRC